MSKKINILKTFKNILYRQYLAFDDAEKGCFCDFQNNDNQYCYSFKIPSSFTGKEKDPETGYSYFGARYLDHELMTAWLSVDPMSDKYPSISPYAYCAWNPLKLVDPNGNELVIVGRRGSTTYSPNMSTEGLDRFTKRTVDALNAMYKTDVGKELIDDLCNPSNSNVFRIIKSNKNRFIEDNSEKAYKVQWQTDPLNNDTYKDAVDKSIYEGGSGGVIRWNPDGTTISTTAGVKVNAIVDLAHEMFHAKDANHGLLDDREEYGIKRSEWQAVYNENIFRTQMGYPLRIHYVRDEHGNGLVTEMLRNGKPIKPWW